MRLRSGAVFAPYCRKPSKHTFHPQTSPDNPITTTVSVEPLVQCAVAREDFCFEHGGDDSEGLGVTSRPLTPLTEIESMDEAEALHPTSGVQPCAKKRRRNAGANKRRAKKRMRLASSGHQPHTYAANPSTVAHRGEELKPLRVLADAKSFPASGSGSWVGQRKNGAKKEPWAVQDLVENKFTFVEWDGR
jgi:hypothetical protein